MAVNITSRTDAEAIIREQVVSTFPGRTKAVRIYEYGTQIAKHDQQPDQDPCIGFPSNCVLGGR